MFTMYKFDLTNNEKRLKKRMEIGNTFSSGLELTLSLAENVVFN